MNHSGKGVSGEDDLAKKARLRRLRSVAVGALVFAALLFVVGKVGEVTHPGWGWVRAFGEAAMIGALADWFAVVALFRHPMGIPFYHTAIVRRNQGRIAGAIGAFFMKHFWQREVLVKVLEERRLMAAVADWTAEQHETWSNAAPGWVAGFVRQLPPDAFDPVVRQLAERFANGVEPGAAGAGIFATLLERGIQHELIDAAAPVLAESIREHRDYLEKKIREEIPLPDQLPLEFGGVRIPTGPAGEWLDRIKHTVAGYLTDRVIEKTTTILGEVETDPAHPLRQSLDDRLQRLVGDMRDDPVWQNRLTTWWESLRESASWEQSLTSIAAQARHALCRVDEPPMDKEVTRLVAQALDTVGTHLRDEQGWGGTLERLIRERILEAALQHRETVHALLVDTVRQWPGGKMADQLELEIGADLQFVRLNGTLVGGLIGLILHAVGHGIQWLH